MICIRDMYVGYMSRTLWGPSPLSTHSMASMEYSGITIYQKWKSPFKGTEKKKRIISMYAFLGDGFLLVSFSPL